MADDRAVERMLSRHHDDTRNFDGNLLLGSQHMPLDRHQLGQQIEAFFRHRADVGLFDLAGLGMIEPAGSFLMASNAVAEAMAWSSTIGPRG